MIARIAADEAVGELGQPILEMRGVEDENRDAQGKTRQSMYGCTSSSDDVLKFSKEEAIEVWIWSSRD